MEYTGIKIIGINGFEFYVDKDSIWHDNAVEAKKIGVKTENVKSNFKGRDISKNIDKVIISEGTINKDKIADEKQIWCLGRHIVNELKNPCFPTEGITTEMCA